MKCQMCGSFTDEYPEVICDQCLNMIDDYASSLPLEFAEEDLN